MKFQSNSQIEDIQSLGESIREKLDKRGLRNLFDEEITKDSLDSGMQRIEDEVLKPMERFINLVRSYDLVRQYKSKMRR